MRSSINDIRSRKPEGPAFKLAYLHGGVVHYRAGDVLPERTLTDYEFVLILDGQIEYRLAGKRYPVSPGGVILARPGFREMYRWDPAALTRHAFFHFQVERWPADWPPQARWPVLRAQPDPVVGALFRSILARMAAHAEWPAGSPGEQDNRLVAALVGAFLEPATYVLGPVAERFPQPVNEALSYMRRLLEDEPHRPVSLRDLARAAGVSGKHLCRLFQGSLRHPPLATLRLIKLQFALALLARSNLAVKEIADRCGFDNPLYFSRCFSRVYGMPPTEARHRLLRHEPPPPSPLPPDLTPRLFW